MQTWLVSGTREVMQRAASVSGSFFLGALGSLLSFVIMLSLLFFFLRDGELLAARARGLIPLDEERKERLFSQLERRDTRDRLRHDHHRHHARRVDRHRLCDRRPAFADRVRRSGGAVLAVAGGRRGIRVDTGRAVAVLFDKHWGSGIFMLVWGLILGGLDNVLRPLLISGRARISAFVVFLGVLGGIPAFGAIGVIAGPVVLSLVLALIEFAEESAPTLPKS